MTALSAQAFPDSRNLGDVRNFPLAAVKCWAGGKAMISAAGFITPALAEASNAGVVGVFLKTVDNSGGAAGDLTVDVEEGDYLMAAVSIAQTDVGSVMYSLDDATFDETQLANQPRTGILVEYVSATQGWVRLSLATAS